MSYDEIQQRIIDRYAVDELVEVLGITVEDILYYFEDKIVVKLDELDIE